jgi:hypothetical protein
MKNLSTIMALPGASKFRKGMNLSVCPSRGDRGVVRLSGSDVVFVGQGRSAPRRR